MLKKIVLKLKKILNYKATIWFAQKSSSNYRTYLIKNGISVGENVIFRVPKNTSIDVTRPSLITIGSNVDINNHFTIMTHDFSSFVFMNYFHDFVNSSGKVKIGNNIYIGTNVTILKGVEIGDNCIVGAGSLVTKSIPPNSVAAGVPCRVLCTLEDYYKKRKQLQLGEAVEYVHSLIERKGKYEKADLFEEWSVFLTEDDYYKYDEFRIQIDKRLKKDTRMWLSGKRIIPGYEAFKKYIQDINNI